MNILLIEDEPEVVGFIKKGLEEQGYSVTATYDGRAGENIAIEKNFDLVEMKNEADGQKAIDELNQKEYEGRSISVSVAKPRAEGPRPGQGHRHDSMAE